MRKPETAEKVCKKLIKEGWKEIPNQMKKYARCFYKRFDTPTRCFGNSDKEGMQIEFAVSDAFNYKTSIEMTLCGGLKDGTWVQFLNYSLKGNLKDALALIPRMLAIWEAANKEGNK